MAHWLHKPAGARGSVQMVGDQFQTEDGQPIRFWGINLGNLDCAPDPAKGQQWADRQAKYGVNCVRLHKFVPAIMLKDSSVELDPQLVDRLDHFTHALKQRGIYYGFSWIFYHTLRQQDYARLKYPEEVREAGGGTSRLLVFIAEDVQQLRLDMLRNLLEHKNPYTGLRYVDDPALAFVELQNEDSIFFYSFRHVSDLEKFPSYKRDFMKRFSEWLLEHYETEAAWRKAWGEQALNAYELKDYGAGQPLVL